MRPPSPLMRMRPAADLLPEFEGARGRSSVAVEVAASNGGGCEGTTPSEGGIAAITNIATRDDAAIIMALTRDLVTSRRGYDGTRIEIGRSEVDIQATRTEFSNREGTWNAREVELMGQLEDAKMALEDAKRDAREGISVVRRLDSALRSARGERDEYKTRMDELIVELKHAREDVERMAEATREAESEKSSMHVERTTAMWELNALREELNALREQSARYHNLDENDAHWELSSLREEVEGLREQSVRIRDLEISNEELKGVLKMVQHHTNKKLRKMKAAASDSQEREERMNREFEKLGRDHCRQTNEIDDMKSAYDELSHKMNEVEVEYANRSKAYEEEIKIQKMRHTSDALQRAEALISSLQREVSLLKAKASRSDKLQRDLAFVQKTNINLARTLSDYKVSSQATEVSSSESQERRIIEHDALREYCTLFREKSELSFDV